MSDKIGRTASGTGSIVGPKPVPMKLFATWEVDRTPSNCIPRLCSLTLSRLVLLRPLGADLQSISIAVKMQSSKRTLRSNELMLPPNGLLDTGLELTFSLQYPHFLKREGNRLHILLQRRKRYKNRTMLGFKTLAEGVIRMDQVLQKQMDLELELMPEGNSKDKGAGPVARLTVQQLSSTPVDQEHKSERERSDFTDEEDEFSSGEEEGGELSDSEPLRSKMPHAGHNLKQRFVSLLKRFRVPDSDVGRGASLANPSDIQALFQELDSLSCDEDSGAEQDTISISSTPKPSLRPFFSSSRSLLDNNSSLADVERLGDDKNCSGSDGNADTGWNEHDLQPADLQLCSPPFDKGLNSQEIAPDTGERRNKLFRTAGVIAKKKNSVSSGPDPVPSEPPVLRKTFLEVVSRLLPAEETSLPETVIILAGGSDSQVTSFCNKINTFHRYFQPLSSLEVKSVLSALFIKLQKYCNSYAKPSSPIKLVLVGGDVLTGWMLRTYVELMSSKPPEWLNYVRIYVAPLGYCTVARHLANADSGYAVLFPPDQDLKGDELASRLLRYLALPLSTPLISLPLAEAMLTCQDDSSQLFIPFVNEVRVGPSEATLSVSVDMDDFMCSSPPGPPLTPPSSPNVQMRESPWEPLELQLDYWPLAKLSEAAKTDRPKPDGKVSLKGTFRGLQATPTPSLGVGLGLALTIHLASKEKKQKIMRLGKKKEKERDSEARSQYVEGISRLICSAKTSHTSPLRVFIDGAEWSGVKFFQLSSTWQTHVKHLSVAMVGAPLASVELP